jgi:hypothetical protein
VNNTASQHLEPRTLVKKLAFKAEKIITPRVALGTIDPRLAGSSADKFWIKEFDSLKLVKRGVMGRINLVIASSSDDKLWIKEFDSLKLVKRGVMGRVNLVTMVHVTSTQKGFVAGLQMLRLVSPCMSPQKHFIGKVVRIRRRASWTLGTQIVKAPLFGNNLVLALKEFKVSQKAISLKH